MHVANLWCIQNNDKYKKMYNENVYVYKANTTALVCMNFDSIFTKGIGSNINFPMIKLTSADKSILKYFYSSRLKNIINKNLETTYIKHSMLIQKILIITIIIIFFLFYRKIV